MVDSSMSQEVFDAVMTCTGLAMMCLAAASTMLLFKLFIFPNDAQVAARNRRVRVR